MERRKILLLIALASVFLSGRAQIYYERWIDNNRGAATRGSLILGEQTISVDASSIKWPGLHFLNIVPYDESGEMGVWKCIPFLMPEGWPNTTEATMMEYWVTGYDSKPVRKAYAGTAVTLDIDASKYSAGLHFLNFRTMNAAGECGPWKQIPFLMPEGWPSTTDAKTLEYWVTGYDRVLKSIDYDSGATTLDIDVSKYSPGLHFLNVRTLNAVGEGGPWKQIPFLMPEGWPGTTEAKTMEYWVTGYDNTPKRLAYTGATVPLDIDISQMSYGLHFLNVRTLNAAGEAGAWRVIPFYISNFIFDEEEMEYEYWIDSGEVMTGTGIIPGMLDLNIDYGSLSAGKHTLSFRAKNTFGLFGEVYTVTFDTNTFTIKGDVNLDGIVDMADIATVISVMAGSASGSLASNADVNGDGKVDVADIATIISEMAAKARVQEGIAE